MHLPEPPNHQKMDWCCVCDSEHGTHTINHNVTTTCDTAQMIAVGAKKRERQRRPRREEEGSVYSARVPGQKVPVTGPGPHHPFPAAGPVPIPGPYKQPISPVLSPPHKRVAYPVVRWVQKMRWCFRRSAAGQSMCSTPGLGD